MNAPRDDGPVNMHGEFGERMLAALGLKSEDHITRIAIEMTAGAAGVSVTVERLLLPNAGEALATAIAHYRLIPKADGDNMIEEQEQRAAGFRAAMLEQPQACQQPSAAADVNAIERAMRAHDNPGPLWPPEHGLPTKP